jgi:hypothetical protein
VAGLALRHAQARGGWISLRIPTFALKETIYTKWCYKSEDITTALLAAEEEEEEEEEAAHCCARGTIQFFANSGSQTNQRSPGRKQSTFFAEAGRRGWRGAGQPTGALGVPTPPPRLDNNDLEEPHVSSRICSPALRRSTKAGSI